MSDVEIRRSADRFRTDQDDITTFHSFSYGRHYDPSNVAFGPVIAINEECIPPDGGYDTHAHADVEIVTWVLEGVLAHEDTAGGGGTIEPGTLSWLSAGEGVQHAERNASDIEPVRFLQIMLRSDDNLPRVSIATGPTTVRGPALVHATHDGVSVNGTELSAGDEARLTDEGPYDVHVPGSSGALIIEVAPA